MKEMTTRQAAEKWGISDRRVRILCAEGKVEGAEKVGRSYRIPEHAAKPADGRYKEEEGCRYLKWDEAVVGIISPDQEVQFTQPDFNPVVSMYTRGQNRWSAEQFDTFLSERIVSRDRRDIERILFRCGLSQYDVRKIAEITRAMHPKDLLWIARSRQETMDSVMTDVFQSVFLQRTDLQGDSVDTPEGYNIKRYGVWKGKYGIFKQRISPLVTDVESEIAVSLLGERLGVACCPAERVDQNTVFSAFLYDFSREYIVHFRRLFDGVRGENEYENLVGVRPRFRDEIARMILLDFITRQDDRHLSNIALKVSSEGEAFYPLYDNGRSLFYEDTPETVEAAACDIEGYATCFGYTGTYWDYVQQIAAERGSLGGLLDLSVSRREVELILERAGFAGYRFHGALEWIMKTIEMIKELG